MKAEYDTITSEILAGSPPKRVHAMVLEWASQHKDERQPVAARLKSQARKLLKQYSSLCAELQVLERDLMADPAQKAYKVSVAVKSKGKGKSRGLRVITCLITEEQEI